MAAGRPGMAGIGLMFADGGGLVGIDLDDCFVGGQLTLPAYNLIRYLKSYSEVSPSGNGVKIWVRGVLPPNVKTKFVSANFGCSRIEVYEKSRYFALTGRRIPFVGNMTLPNEVESRQSKLDCLMTRLAANSLRPPPPAADVTAPPAPPTPAPAPTPQAIVDRCRNYLREIGPAISGQCGHDRTFRAASACFKFGLSDAEAFAMLAAWNSSCLPPWSEPELLHKLTDVKAKAMADGTFGVMARKLYAKPTPTDRPLPKWIDDLPHSGPGKLTVTQRAILKAVASGCRAEPVDRHGSLGYHVIGFADLAKLAKVGYRTVGNHIPALEAMGILVVTERGGILPTGEVRANRYMIPGAYGVQDVHTPTTPQTGK